jgi:hypothetical protein
VLQKPEHERDFRKLIAKHFYLASCDGCGWFGSSEECGTDQDDVTCPACHQSGADCGAVARAAEEVERLVTIRKRHEKS